jgi:hypothetical protein
MAKSMTYMLEPRRYSRRWWAENARRLVWVVLITALIWVYADMEFTDEMEYSLTVRLTTAKNGSITLVEPTDGPDVVRQREVIDEEIRIRLRGSRGALEQVREEFNDRRWVVDVDVSERFIRDRQRYSLQVDALLNQALELDEEGLVVVSASRESIEVRMEERIRLEVPVEFVPTNGTLDGPAVVSPAKVGVVAAASRWEKILTETDRDPVLRATYDLSNVTSDKIETVPAKIIPILAGVSVSPEQPTVEVKLKVQDLTERLTLSVIVRVLTPHTWAYDATWEEYELESTEDFWYRKEITVSGTETSINELKRQQKDLDAYIQLKDDDKDKGYISRPVKLRFPDGVDVELVGPAPTVSVRMVKKDSAGG